eukprot:TRINITY_DN3768_c0_g1_i2.p1 TRINITY_DN3768_c0_g1~~TRINITY_DN3768_c0_g1_i2.p1  ORF type:complete len:300 (+),score=112.02 TRINITY_DN3768_c0_g1_i2:123-1022(+)
MAEVEVDTLTGFKTNKAKDYINKQRTLILCSRGVTYLQRHLMLDMAALLPNTKKEAKLEKDRVSEQLNDLCQYNACNNLLYFESKKKKDLYLWMGRAPSGPSVKFHVENIHTSEELKMTGNCMKGSRPFLSFDSNFDNDAHWRLVKEMLVQIFGVPKNHPKTVPFFDHVFSFTIADGRVWFRNYQIFREQEKPEPELIEIGPRFVLNPIKICEGNLSGMVLFLNEKYVSPNVARREQRNKKMKGKSMRAIKKNKKKVYELPTDDLEEFMAQQELERAEEEGDDEGPLQPASKSIKKARR